MKIDEIKKLQKLLIKCHLNPETYDESLIVLNWKTECSENVTMKIEQESYSSLSIKTAINLTIPKNKIDAISEFITLCNNTSTRNWISLNSEENTICVHSVEMVGQSIDYKNMKSQLYSNMQFDVKCIDLISKSVNAIISSESDELSEYWHYIDSIETFEKSA